MRILFTTVPVICLLLGIVSCQNSASSPRDNRLSLKVQEDADGVSITAGQQTFLRYHLSTQYPDDSLPAYYQRSGFIHPLTTPSGKVITEDFPEGHTHHHGIFYALVNTTFRGQKVDFWNQHQQSGTVRAKAILGSREEENSVGFSSMQEHLAIQDGDTLVALEERWEVNVSSADPFLVIDLSSTLYPAGADSLIVNKYHYGGLGVRGPEAWNNLSFRQPKEGTKVNFIGKNGQGGFLTDEGLGRIEANHSRPQWISFYGTLGQDSVGLVVMGHPDNFRYPEPVRTHPEMPYFSVSPMVPDSFVLRPGDTLISRYRILTYDGAPPVEKIEAAAKAYQEKKSPTSF